MLDLKYDEKGLIPVICQDADTLQVLMMAYAKEEQIQKTLQTGYATYFSRSRNIEWIKGSRGRRSRARRDGRRRPRWRRPCGLGRARAWRP